jgi:UDP-N-acetylglucosamine:LPS N-acetylglucosamine transferase
MGGSAGSLDLNNMMLKEIKNLDRAYLKNIKFFIQIPEFQIKVLKKKYSELLDKNNCEFFSFKDDLNPQEYDIILSRSGSGSVNEILYYTNNVYFIPHLISRDQHQKFNLDYFLSHDMSLKNFYIPNKKNFTSQFYFNPLINPHSIKKIICYITR